MSQPSRARPTQATNAALVCLSILIAWSGALPGQTQTDSAAYKGLSWSTDSAGPQRFVSVHGRRAAVFGYSQDQSHGHSDGGLEIWAYPVQILSSYSVAFRPAGETTVIDGESILRRIVYSPEAVTRIYAGPDFIVREKLFVPLDDPGAIISYEVEGSRQVDINIRFTPVLDLMWPASSGGQEALWNSAASAYLLTELPRRFSASIGSPDIVAHDDTQNSANPVGHGTRLAFTIRAGASRKAARVIIAGSGPGQDPNQLSDKLLTNSASLEKEAVDHYAALLNHALQIETPDADTNRALAWSEIALDQAWVCNPDLGCGIVAGYGPSRKARRPQYDWFFAGDGMVAIQGLLAAGEYARARKELEFIIKYQDRRTGMIWHEMSQSAGLLDWTKYPYMFAHVDLTFQFLSTVGNYFFVTGDQDFVRAHWPSIQSAYDYCRSTLDAKDGLPRIPADKEGGREQDSLSDELMLSASWASSAQAFAKLAAATRHAAEANEANAASQRARSALGQRYWDARQHLWITGFTRSNAPLVVHDIGPGRIMHKNLFSAAQRASIFDQIASSDFQTDWGTRGNAASASSYNPNSYSSGSVWATGTSEIASAFWAEHRPATALPIWRALIPWSSLDSLGHIHEALAGDYYHEEVESVPEQTWSASSFFAAFVNGLLGLQIDGGANRIAFAPHLPPSWNSVTVRNLRVGSSEISLTLIQSGDEVQLQMQNQGTAVQMVFDPEIPLGAKLGVTQLDKETIAATLEENSQDSHAKVEFSLPHGGTVLAIGYVGGVAIRTDPPPRMVGESSRTIKITGVNLNDHVYRVDFDYLPSDANSFDLRTGWAIKAVEGANYEPISPSVYRFYVKRSTNEKEPPIYQHGEVAVTFER